VVEAVVNKLTRLGRVRRMGVVFATHGPADLNDLSQLTNTKIAMRSLRCLNAWLNTPGS
jgi:DNA helicase HerA-like ATPase